MREAPTADRPSHSGVRNVEGNARLTGTLGAALFVLLAVEGVTLLSVRSLLSVHACVGVLVGAAALAKLGSVTYRFARYYARDPDYSRKGPPHPILRVVGPLVVVSTIALVATGVVALGAGRDQRSLIDLHRVAFFVWLPLMSVHVLGHLLDTPELVAADYQPDALAAPGRWARLTVVAVTVLTGAVFGVAVLSSGWLDGWQRTFGR